MHDLRFSGFLLVAILSPMAWAQTAEPSITQQPQLGESKQAQDQIPAITPAAPAVQNDRFKDSPTLEYFRFRTIPQKTESDEKALIGSFHRGFRAAIQPGSIERKRIDPLDLGEDFREAMDRGIRLNPAGAGMCGSIVSYNFSTSAPGEVPHLESVTTCTPADKVVQRRAENPGRKPAPPRLLKTSSPER